MIMNFKNKIFDILQFLITFLLYWWVYQHYYDILYSNSLKGPASMVINTYAHAAILANYGFFFILFPFYIIWRNKEKYNWRGMINVHIKYSPIILLGYLYSIIIYWVSYKASFYNSKIDISFFSYISIFLFAVLVFYYHANEKSSND